MGGTSRPAKQRGRETIDDEDPNPRDSSNRIQETPKTTRRGYQGQRGSRQAPRQNPGARQRKSETSRRDSTSLRTVRSPQNQAGRCEEVTKPDPRRIQGRRRAIPGCPENNRSS